MELAEWEMNVERQTFKSVAYKKAARALASLDYRYFMSPDFMFRFRIWIQITDPDPVPDRIWIQIRIQLKIVQNFLHITDFVKEPLVQTSTLARPLLTLLLGPLQVLLRFLQESQGSWRHSQG